MNKIRVERRSRTWFATASVLLRIGFWAGYGLRMATTERILDTNSVLIAPCVSFALLGGVLFGQQVIASFDVSIVVLLAISGARAMPGHLPSAWLLIATATATAIPSLLVLSGRVDLVGRSRAGEGRRR